MQADMLVERILDDEGLTGDLEEAEAAMLVKELVKRAEAIAAKSKDADAARAQVEQLCKRGRAIAATVAAFRQKGEQAGQAIAKQAGLSWPQGTANSLDLLGRLLKD